MRTHIQCGLIALLLSGVFALAVCAHAQPGASEGSAVPVRYQYGDNPAWAQPDLDDSSWRIAPKGEFGAPRFDSDGFFWVRVKLPVPSGVNGPFAIQSWSPNSVLDVLEIFVNGVHVGAYGEFPPHAAPRILPQVLVFDLPPRTVAPGAMATVVLRGWTFPSNRDRGASGKPEARIVTRFRIDNASLLHAQAAAVQARTAIRHAPQLAVGLVFLVFGIGVLGLGFWSRSRELLLCAIWLVAAPLFLSFYSISTLAAGADFSTLSTAFEIVNGLGMAFALELFWTVQGFRNRFFLNLGRLCWIAVTLSGVLMSHITTAGAVADWSLYLHEGPLVAFNILMCGASLWALGGRGRNRPIAAAILLIVTGYFLKLAGLSITIGFLPLDVFQAAFYLSVFTVSAILIRQTWNRWREGEDLRIEFAAGRELQQQLVPRSLPDLATLRMSSAYLPAKDVGGDFYQVIDLCDGATLFLLGDVSGKGLKAAMTGLLTIGAANALAADTCEPSILLQRLNREICRLRNEGFITCLCVSISTDGVATVANAGHLTPYLNRDELALESGLPLGLVPHADYPSTTIQLEPGDTLTLLSDGVVEAQSSSGELFGFERTLAIIHEPAEVIARAAMAHGQADDITVLSVTFVPAAVRA